MFVRRHFNIFLNSEKVIQDFVAASCLGVGPKIIKLDRNIQESNATVLAEDVDGDLDSIIKIVDENKDISHLEKDRFLKFISSEVSRINEKFPENKDISNFGFIWNYLPVDKIYVDTCTGRVPNFKIIKRNF